ncbi:MAG TPA: hypothetical protein PLD88_13245, partial [Candidatus Berkiella sp.]|nr:hypothetical protein [Candidatus Berkiella sp.]
MHQGPDSTLISLKNRLDPMDQSAPAVNLLTISADEFAHIINDFNTVLSQDLSYLRPKDQLEAIWLYMAVTFYVHHWASDTLNGQLVQMQEKLHIIKT